MPRNLLKELVSFIIIFIVGGSIQTYIFCSDCTELSRILWIFSYSGFLWIVLWKGSEWNFTLNEKYISWIETPLKRLTASILGIAIITFMGYYGNDILFNVILWGNSFEEYRDSFDITDITIPLLVCYGINLIMYGRGFLFRWREEAINLEKLRTEHVNSQYETLKNQVNPHFLFNSLNALSYLVYDDQEKAVTFIRKLSEVYRYVLDNRDVKLVSIQDELEFVNSFVFLQKIRFGDNLNVEIDIPEDLPKYVPPLALQTLVENAIKHNVVAEKYPLHLSIKKTESDTIEIKNTIKEKLNSTSTGIGLQNLTKRYEFLSDRKFEYGKVGDQFVVHLPLLNYQT